MTDSLPMVGSSGASWYGDPCRECGFSWAISVDEGIAVVTSLPDACALVLRGATGAERHPDLAWSAAEYVCHVGDNLRIWAERLMGVVEGAAPEIGDYNENELAYARNYGSIPLPAALWSLGRAVDDWQLAVGRSSPTGTVVIHPERGEQSLSDVVVSNAHDCLHHLWDVERSLPVNRR